MIEKAIWQKGLLALALVIAVGLFYAVSNVERSTESLWVDLGVVEEGALPASGGVFGTSPENVSASARGLAGGPVGEERAGQPAEGFAAENETGQASAPESESVISTTSVLVQAVGDRSKSLDAFRVARTVARSRRIEALERSLELHDLPPQRREAMVAELLALVESEELEQQAEGLLVARGFSDVLVYLANQRAEVIVADPIDRDEAGRIGELLGRVAGVPPERITIVDGAAH